MKKQILILTLTLSLTFFFLRFTMPEPKTVNDDNKITEFSIPDDIQPIIKKSCFGCHNQNGKNDKAKKKLLLDQLGKLSKSKLVGKLSKITEMVRKGDMPPPMFLEKFPDAKPTGEEKQKLIIWSEKESNKLMKK